MKDLPTDEYVVDEEEEEAPSSMEVALRAAMEAQGVQFVARAETRREKKPSKRQQQTQDDIIARTLQARQG